MFPLVKHLMTPRSDCQHPHVIIFVNLTFFDYTCQLADLTDKYEKYRLSHQRDLDVLNEKQKKSEVQYQGAIKDKNSILTQLAAKEAEIGTVLGQKGYFWTRAFAHSEGKGSAIGLLFNNGADSKSASSNKISLPFFFFPC